MPPGLVPEVRARLCKDILCVYSSTRIWAGGFRSIDRILEQPGSTGFLAPWVEVAIIGPDNQPMPRGIEGRLRVRTKWQGYDLMRAQTRRTGGCILATSGASLPMACLPLLDALLTPSISEDTFISPEQIERELSGYPGLLMWPSWACRKRAAISKFGSASWRKPR